jgi:hypothetical protein
MLIHAHAHPTVTTLYGRLTNHPMFLLLENDSTSQQELGFDPMVDGYMDIQTLILFDRHDPPTTLNPMVNFFSPFLLFD